MCALNRSRPPSLLGCGGRLILDITKPERVAVVGQFHKKPLVFDVQREPFFGHDIVGWHRRLEGLECLGAHGQASHVVPCVRLHISEQPVRSTQGAPCYVSQKSLELPRKLPPHTCSCIQRLIEALVARETCDQFSRCPSLLICNSAANEGL